MDDNVFELCDDEAARLAATLSHEIAFFEGIGFCPPDRLGGLHASLCLLPPADRSPLQQRTDALQQHGSTAHNRRSREPGTPSSDNGSPPAKRQRGAPEDDAEEAPEEDIIVAESPEDGAEAPKDDVEAPESPEEAKTPEDSADAPESPDVDMGAAESEGAESPEDDAEAFGEDVIVPDPSESPVYDAESPGEYGVTSEFPEDDVEATESPDEDMEDAPEFPEGTESPEDGAEAPEEDVIIPESPENDAVAPESPEEAKPPEDNAEAPESPDVDMGAPEPPESPEEDGVEAPESPEDNAGAPEAPKDGEDVSCTTPPPPGCDGGGERLSPPLPPPPLHPEQQQQQQQHAATRVSPSSSSSSDRFSFEIPMDDMPDAGCTAPAPAAPATTCAADPPEASPTSHHPPASAEPCAGGGSSATPDPPGSALPPPPPPPPSPPPSGDNMDHRHTPPAQPQPAALLCPKEEPRARQSPSLVESAGCDAPADSTAGAAAESTAVSGVPSPPQSPRSFAGGGVGRRVDRRKLAEARSPEGVAVLQRGLPLGYRLARVAFACSVSPVPEFSEDEASSGSGGPCGAADAESADRCVTFDTAPPATPPNPHTTSRTTLVVAADYSSLTPIPWMENISLDGAALQHFAMSVNGHPLPTPRNWNLPPSASSGVAADGSNERFFKTYTSAAIPPEALVPVEQKQDPSGASDSQGSPAGKPKAKAKGKGKRKGKGKEKGGHFFCARFANGVTTWRCCLLGLEVEVSGVGERCREVPPLEEGGGGGGVEAESVPLLCPLTRLRLSTPARGVRCAHPDCFDLSAFLQISTSTCLWSCPVCVSALPPSDIRVDVALSSFLEANPGSASTAVLREGVGWEALPPLPPDPPRDYIDLD